MLSSSPRPASVKLRLLVVRLISLAPSRVSKVATARVTAGGDMPSRRAAVAKPPLSATVANTSIVRRRSTFIPDLGMVCCDLPLF